MIFQVEILDGIAVAERYSWTYLLLPPPPPNCPISRRLTRTIQHSRGRHEPFLLVTFRFLERKSGEILFGKRKRTGFVGVQNCSGGGCDDHG